MFILRNNLAEYIVAPVGRSPSITLNADKATRFNTEAAAQTFAKSSISKKLKDRGGPFDVFCVDLVCNGDANTNDADENSRANLSDDMVSVLDTVQMIKKQLNDLLSTKDELVATLSTLDQKLVDLDHFMEFNDCNVVDSFKLLRMRQSVLRERRKVKMKLQVMQSIKDNCGGILDESVENTIYSLSEVVYTPRKLNKLFSGVKIKDYDMSMDDVSNVQADKI